jgi:SAM-dependent methyltransferase
MPVAEKDQKGCCAPSCCASDTDVREERPRPAEALVEKVRERYGRIAAGGATGCCGPQGASVSGPEEAVSRGAGYDPADLAAVPEGANLGLGCGAPLTFLALQPGETVLDLGSGPGLDALLAARQVGGQGRVIGVDMTREMIERATRNARTAGAPQVEFREGRLEALPVESASVDAVTSNCVINLVPDKSAVFREVARVLRSGGRLVISDILLDGALPAAIQDDLLAYVGCVAGAMRRESYFALLGAAGLTDVEVLRDVDYVAGLAASAPEEVEALERSTGVSRDAVLGRVRSVTFRARKP